VSAAWVQTARPAPGASAAPPGRDAPSRRGPSVAARHDFAAVRIQLLDAQRPTPTSKPAATDKPTCKEFPGGSTDCEINATTGTPTGRVTTKVDETNPCTKPCVEKHEAVHVKQMEQLCAALRDCYADADKGKRPAGDCFKLAIGSSAKNECEAYAVSVPCVEQRLKNAPECKSPANQRYGAEKLESEKCWRDHYCGAK